MSGGEYRYFYNKLLDFAGEILNDDDQIVQPCPRSNYELRLEFSKLLEDIAVCCKTIEWTDSGDLSEEDMVECLQKMLSRIKK